MAQALDNALSVLENDGSSQEIVDAVCAALQEAIDSLENYIPVIPDVAVNSVQINGASLITIKKSETSKLTASLIPVDATNPSVIWSSSNSSVAGIDENGVITGYATGMVVITVTTVDGGFMNSIVVKVTN